MPPRVTLGDTANVAGDESGTAGAGWDVSSPSAVLLVDRRPILELLATHAVIASARIAIVCIDGTPALTVARLKEAFRGGLRAPVLYVHDAATVIYPFTVEPIATILEHGGPERLRYVDLGLPPLGATARRFRDPALLGKRPILALDEIPPEALARYCVEAANRHRF